MRTLVVGDLHLARVTPKKVGDAFADFLAQHRGTRVVVCGDLFDFSADHPKSTVDAALGAHPRARAELALHVDHGGELWLASGNHDAEVGRAGFARELGDALGVRAHDRIQTSPWFLRVGRVHLEHGHVFDPDNAPAHPLVQSESLGVHFVKEFIAKTGAHAYINKNDEKPLALFLSSFTMYGPRAPFVIYKYFEAAFAALARSGPFFRDPGSSEADVAIAEFARRAEISEDEARALASLVPRPTLASMRETFARMYLDRVLATVSVAAGGATWISGHKRAGAALVGLGAIGLAVSWGVSFDRYGGATHERLQRGARDVRDACGADLVVFGHTHREAEGAHYANTGSFAFPKSDRGRPFLELVDHNGVTARAERRFFR